MNANLIDQGLNLLIYGMGTVFVFLTILVGATTLMSKLINIGSTSENELPEGSPTDAGAATNSNPKPEIVLAIKEAIALHRKANKK